MTFGWLSLPKTNVFAPEKWCLEDDPTFLWGQGLPIFRGVCLLVQDCQVHTSRAEWYGSMKFMDSFVYPANCSELYVQDEKGKERWETFRGWRWLYGASYGRLTLEREDDGCTEQEEDNEGAQAAMEKVKDLKAANNNSTSDDEEPPPQSVGRECIDRHKTADSVMMFVFVFSAKTTPKRVPAMYYEGSSSYYGDPINFEPYSHTAPSLQGSFAFTMEPPPAITLGACQCQRVWRYHGTREVRRLIFGGVNITQ